MKLLVSRKLIGAAFLALLLITVSTDALGQGRNRRVIGRTDKKCDKFVNCHDARDGRWDGRGPRRDDDDTVLGRIFRRTRRNRDRDVWDGRRGRRRDRDFDRDRTWRRRR